MVTKFFCKRVSLSVLTFMMLFLLFFSAGCVTLPPPDPNNPVAKVAVLPMANETADMDGCTFVRVAFHQIVPSRKKKNKKKEKKKKKKKNKKRKIIIVLIC